MLASPIATLSLRAIAIGASAPLAARERPERYEPCTARCTAKYAYEGRHGGPNCFTNFNKCRSLCWRDWPT
jgi:hypothetical protein